MPQGTPTWLKLVLRAERLVGERVESAVHSGTYFDLTTRAKRTTTKATEAVEGVSRRILHLANLPAGTDIRRVREQLSRMERRIVELSKEVDELREVDTARVADTARLADAVHEASAAAEADVEPTVHETR
jgi:hypothetical protein